MMEESERTIIAKLIEVVDGVSSGNKPNPVDTTEIVVSNNPLLNELAEKLCKLNNQYGESYQLILDLSRGKLNSETPVRNPFVNPYKQLQSELRYLTWQIQQIADGDYNQRVYFSGDFSYTINKMVIALRDRRELAEKLAESNKTKDTLFSIIAHDLRNPFNIIMGFSELLVQAIEDHDLESAKEYAGMIDSSTHRTYDLLMNLLEWSRLQSVGITMSPQEIDLKLIILSNIRIAKFAASVKNITIHFEEPDSHPFVTDSGMLNTVLRNLINNAIKYTPENGSITISLQKKDQFYYISVQDNGVGMSEETINNIFYLKTIHSSPGTNNEPGTGLGLVLCNDFVQMMGGEINVESKVGSGTTFTFSLPIVS